MSTAFPARAAALVLIAAGFAMGPVLAEARPGISGGGASSVSRGGGGGGGFSGASSRPSGGYGASTRPPSGRGTAAPTRPAGGNRVNNVNTSNVNVNRNVNVNVDNDNGWGWNDNYRPVGAAVVAGAVAGAVMGSMVYSLPHGCSPYVYGGYTYYNCGNVYYETRYEGDKVVYVVVDQPG